MRIVFLFLFALFFPFVANAQVEINEIMYDLEGADTGREWVEIFNNSENEVDLKDWKFNDGSNHILNKPPKNSGRGSLIIPAKRYAVFADNAETFFSEHSDYNGILIDTVMSLNNTTAVLKLFNKEGAEIDSVSYNNTLGANGNGNSLQKLNGKWTAAPPSPGIKNKELSQSASQNSVADGADDGQDIPANFVPAQNSGGGAEAFLEKNIKAFAGEDKTGIVGADIEFNGKALGLNNEPMRGANVRFIWNFGDGASKEGATTRHVYSFPGEYIVFLTVSSGEYSASDRLEARVVQNEVKIYKANSLAVKISNGTATEIDISYWQLNQGNNFFSFPKNTFIKGNGFLSVSKETTGFSFEAEKANVKLLYPNGSLADEFFYEEETVITGDGAGQTTPIIPINMPVVIKSDNFKDSSVADKKDKAEPSQTKNLTEKELLKPQETKSEDQMSYINRSNAAVVLKDGNFFKIGKWFFTAFGAFLISISGAAFFVFRKTKNN